MPLDLSKNTIRSGIMVLQMWNLPLRIFAKWDPGILRFTSFYAFGVLWQIGNPDSFCFSNEGNTILAYENPAKI